MCVRHCSSLHATLFNYHVIRKCFHTTCDQYKFFGHLTTIRMSNSKRGLPFIGAQICNVQKFSPIVSWTRVSSQILYIGDTSRFKIQVYSRPIDGKHYSSSSSSSHTTTSHNMQLINSTLSLLFFQLYYIMLSTHHKTKKNKFLSARLSSH